MINSFKIQNLDKIKYLSINSLGNINLIIGLNGSMKSDLVEFLHAFTMYVNSNYRVPFKSWLFRFYGFNNISNLKFEINFNGYDFKYELNHNDFTELNSIPELKIKTNIQHKRNQFDMGIFSFNNDFIFIDEFETSLHPKYILENLDHLENFAKNKTQFFITTNSYFVLKKIALMQNKLSVKLIDLDNAGSDFFNNSIINESIKLYEEEVSQILG